jgi:hypothetical protein
MGLFDKKKKGDEFESPVEEISLEAASPPPVPEAAPPAPARRAPEPAEEAPEFGIEKAIELMRRLPGDNVELVVQVVKTTLESIHVKVATIIVDAAKKEKRLEDRVATLKREIAELEAEIATRKTQIEAIDADHAETRSVKERLQLAEKLQQGEKKAAAR